MTQQTSKYIIICVHIIISMHKEIAFCKQVAVVVMAREAQNSSDMFEAILVGKALAAQRGAPKRIKR